MATNKPGRKYRGSFVVVVALRIAGRLFLNCQKVTDIIKPLEAVVIQEVIVAPHSSSSVDRSNHRRQKRKVDAPRPPFVPMKWRRSPQQRHCFGCDACTCCHCASPAVSETQAPAAQDLRVLIVACPTQVAPEVPERAIQDGLFGVVRAQALIRGWRCSRSLFCQDHEFHAAVKAAGNTSAPPTVARCRQLGFNSKLNSRTRFDSGGLMPPKRIQVQTRQLDSPTAKGNCGRRPFSFPGQTNLSVC
jgi:protein TonB